MSSRIGVGGMGEVFAAYDAQIGREVAIKRLRDRSPTREALVRFMREARIQGRLEHPAIAPVHEVGYDEDGHPYFVMKKLAGITLAEAMRSRRSKFSRERLLHAFVDVCFAIELAHTRGVIHRDLKPSNILLGEFGDVYVLDWGIAREIGDAESPHAPNREATDEGSDATTPGSTLGTAGYMAPEQIRGVADLDGRADVYALGCVLFEILAGSALHPKGDEGIRCALGEYDARPSSRTTTEIPPELDELCERATARSRKARGTARELGEAIQRYLDGDRDLAERARLAREHLAAARAALARDGDSEEARRTAMREAGRSLALDPTLHGAAEVVGHLMIEPPRETPRAVVAELEAIAEANGRRQARIGITVHVGYFFVAGMLLVLGIRDPLYIAALAGLSLLNIALAVGGTKNRARWLVRVIIFTNVLIIALFARMFSPFLVAPGVGAVSLMAFAFHPAANSPKALATVLVFAILAVLAPWAAELAGLVTPTTQISDGSIFMLSTMRGIEAVPVELLLGVFVSVLFVIATVLAYSVARAERNARRHLHVQAWQLRQLLSVPTPLKSDHA